MGTKRKLGNTSEERQANFEKIIYLYIEKNFSLEDIAKKFNASKQAINQFLVKRGFVPEKEKDIKNKQFREKAKKYKNALTEIKEIVEQGVKIHDDIIVSKQILQKINEVIDA